MPPDNNRLRLRRFHKGKRLASKIQAVVVVSAAVMVKVIAPQLLVPLAKAGIVRIQNPDKK